MPDLPDLPDLPDDTEGTRYELIDGSLYMTPSADAPHQMLCFDLGQVLAFPHPVRAAGRPGSQHDRR